MHKSLAVMLPIANRALREFFIYILRQNKVPDNVLNHHIDIIVIIMRK